jgi:hypothetical protein
MNDDANNDVDNNLHKQLHELSSLYYSKCIARCLMNYYKMSYVTPLICDKWVFEKRFDNFNVLSINFYPNYIHCFELFKVIHQSDNKFVEVLNRSLIGTPNKTMIIYFNQIYYILFQMN